MSGKRFAHERDNDEPFERDSYDGRQPTPEVVRLLLLSGQAMSAQSDWAAIDWCFRRRLQMAQSDARFITKLADRPLPLPPEERARLYDVVRDLGRKRIAL